MRLFQVGVCFFVIFPPIFEAPGGPSLRPLSKSIYIYMLLLEYLLEYLVTSRLATAQNHRVFGK